MHVTLGYFFTYHFFFIIYQQGMKRKLLLTCGHRVTCGVCRCFVLSLILTEGNGPSLPFMHREQLNHNHIPVDCTIPSL